MNQDLEIRIWYKASLYLQPTPPLVKRCTIRYIQEITDRQQGRTKYHFFNKIY